MVKKHTFKKTKETDRDREELRNLQDLPLVGGLFKGLEKFVDLVERVEGAGGEIKKREEIKDDEGKTKGIFGFSIKTGIGGKSHIQTFGNIKPTKEKAGKTKIKMAETREPMVDVFDEKNHLLVIAELPGISEQEIEVNVKGDILVIEAGGDERKYYKEILLPPAVDAGTQVRTYKNGILEIKFKKV